MLVHLMFSRIGYCTHMFHVRYWEVWRDGRRYDEPNPLLALRKHKLNSSHLERELLVRTNAVSRAGTSVQARPVSVQIKIYPAARPSKGELSEGAVEDCQVCEQGSKLWSEWKMRWYLCP